MTKPADLKTAPAAPIPGLNMQLGLRHVGGNETLYLRLLQRFARDFAGFTTRVETLLAADSWDDAVREAHTFRGLSATLGAGELELLAAGLEKALASRSLHVVLEKLAVTGAAFELMAAALDAKFAKDEPPNDPASISS